MHPDKSPTGTQDPPGVCSVDSLRVGMRLSQNIHDRRGLLLLAAGSTVTPELLDMLRSRRIRWVRVEESATPPSIEAATPPSPAGTDRAPPSTPGVTGRPRLPRHEFKQQLLRGLERHTAARGRVADTFGTLRAGRAVPESDLRRLVGELADMVALDLDLIPAILSLQSTPDEYLFHHSLNVAALSVTLGAQLGLPRESIMELGVGALLHDVGMLRVPEAIRLAPRPLTHAERAEVRRHPTYTADYIEKIPGLPPASTLIGFQIHERIDQSGYPARRSATTMHPHAKIAAVADAYAAMTCPRPHRPPLVPYVAVKTILHECASKKFAPDSVRALLDCMSLFPIGSDVELDDGRRARVVRANPGLHTLPVVEELDRNEPTGRLLDLSQESGLTVVRAASP